MTSSVITGCSTGISLTSNSAIVSFAAIDHCHLDSNGLASTPFRRAPGTGRLLPRTQRRTTTHLRRRWYCSGGSNATVSCWSPVRRPGTATPGSSGRGRTPRQPSTSPTASSRATRVTACRRSGPPRSRPAATHAGPERHGDVRLDRLVLVEVKGARAGNGGPDRNQTCDTRFRKPLLYQLSYGPGVFVRPI